MPKDKKEKKSKVAETVEDVEMVDTLPKVCFFDCRKVLCVSGGGGTDFEAVHRRRRRRPRRKEETWSLFPTILAPLPSHWPKRGCRRNCLKLSNGVCTLEKVDVRCVVANASLPYTASRYRQVKRGVKEVVKGIRKGEKG